MSERESEREDLVTSKVEVERRRRFTFFSESAKRISEIVHCSFVFKLFLSFFTSLFFARETYQVREAALLFRSIID